MLCEVLEMNRRCVCGGISTTWATKLVQFSTSNFFFFFFFFKLHNKVEIKHNVLTSCCSYVGFPIRLGFFCTCVYQIANLLPSTQLLQEDKVHFSEPNKAVVHCRICSGHSTTKEEVYSQEENWFGKLVARNLRILGEIERRMTRSS